ncbi:MAG: BamA/TamA family outer membrane protein [Salinibacter sp.]|uniref:BamA/TamA family outer membrane protein n=1 Tax=Salinibacter sp. TaxID=2065818 RepID=UPI0035D496C8
MGLLCGGGRACAQEASGQSAARGTLPDSASSQAATKTPSRAARWRQKRRAKAQTLTPPEPGFFDRVGRFFARTSGAVVPRRFIVTVPQLGVAGFHPVLGGLGGNAGMTAGVLYKPPFSQAEHRLASLEVLGSLQDYYGTEALFGIESGRYVGYAYARYQHRPREQFFGVGSGSSKSNESVYKLDESIFGGLLGRSVGANALLGGHVSYRVDRYGAGQGSLPSVSERFGEELPGVGADIDYLMIGGFFEYDSRDTPYPRAFGRRFAPTKRRLRSVSLDATRGYYLSTEITHNLNTQRRAFDFTRFTLDMREFVPVDENLMHGFAFRQFVSVTRSSDGRVPFYRLQSIGGARSLRGYSSGRFHGRNVALLNAELRCQVWHWLDMAVFADLGHVFHDLEGVGLGDPRLGYGVGFRIKKGGQTLGRLDIARSEAGVTMHLDVGSLF